MGADERISSYFSNKSSRSLNIRLTAITLSGDALLATSPNVISLPKKLEIRSDARFMCLLTSSLSRSKQVSLFCW